jgi:hypothetical protein
MPKSNRIGSKGRVSSSIKPSAIKKEVAARTSSFNVTPKPVPSLIEASHCTTEKAMTIITGWWRR